MDAHIQLTADEARWLYALQRPWPLVSRPLTVLGEALGASEAQLVGLIERLRAAGMVRRVGAVFDARRLGYRSCLYALRAEGPALAAAAARVCALPGVTHAYERAWPADFAAAGVSAQDYAPYPNLWWTLSAPAESFEAEAARLADLAPTPFPALKRYKIDVVFDARTRQRDEQTEYRAQAAAPVPEVVAAAPCSPEAVAIIRRYQDDTAALTAPWREADLPQLRAWQADGTMRRFALLLHHRAGGFVANGMCCWQVAPAACDEAGRRLAAEADVTHCYARPASAAFPFTLYAMIHKRSWASGYETFQRLGGLIGAPAGKVFFSTREFKKSSIRFFTEEA